MPLYAHGQTGSVPVLPPQDQRAGGSLFGVGEWAGGLAGFWFSEVFCTFPVFQEVLCKGPGRVRRSSGPSSQPRGPIPSMVLAALSGLCHKACTVPGRMCEMGQGNRFQPAGKCLECKKQPTTRLFPVVTSWPAGVRLASGGAGQRVGVRAVY